MNHPQFPDLTTPLFLLETQLREAEQLHADGAFEQAAEKYRALLADNPALSRTAYNLGLAMLQLQDYPAAEAAFRHTLAIEPDLPEARLNLAFSIQEQGRFSEARRAYRNIIESNPESSEARFNLACLRLLLGELPGAWQDYELRFFTHDPTAQRHQELPLWDGRMIPGLRLLVHSEQGYGDSIQMSRYLALLAQSGVQVYLETSTALLPLLGRIPGLAGSWIRGESLPAVDVRIPLMSLPHRFNTSLHSIPPPACLSPDTTAVAEFAALLPSSLQMRIGLCWSGRLDLPVNRKRRIPLDQLQPLLTTPGTSWVSLQIGAPPDDKIGSGIVDVTSLLTDFQATAALIANLDLVITIDSAVAHLSATLNVPTWLLLPNVPDWRWLLDREDSPWYPSMRLFRQPEPGAWQPVIRQLKQALMQLCSSDAAKLTDRGALLDDGAQYAEACNCYRKALALCPDSAVTHFNLGNTLWHMGRRDEAITAFLHALRHAPHLPEAHHNLAVLYREQGFSHDARHHLECALRLRPDFSDALHTKGEFLLFDERFEEAIATFRHLLQLDANRPSTWNMLGITYQSAELDQEAEPCYRAAIERDPEHLHALNNLGAVLLNLGRIDESVVALEQLLKLAPDYNDGHWNLAGALLASGAWKQGWAEFEYRFLKHGPVVLPPSNLPLWDGSCLGGQGILLQGEQAFGDTIQFIRFTVLVAEKGGVVHVACQHPALVPLIATAPNVASAFHQSEPTPESCICRMPLMSLPHVLGLTLDQLHTAAPSPYLVPPQERVAAWKEKIPDGAGIRVGLCWSGRQTLRNRRRSCPPELLHAFAKVSGVSLFSLQVGGSLPPPGLSLLDMTEEIHDFADSAALISCLDLIITIDTAVAHLAGALGKPVWLMLPDTIDWRWMSMRSDSPWYPTMRIFRLDSATGWQGLLEQITAELHRLTPPKSANELLKDIPQLMEDGDLYRQQEQWHKALQQYQLVMCLRPQHQLALLRAGGCLILLNRHAEALSYLGMAARLMPDDPDAHVNLAVCYLATGQWQQGWDAFEWRRRYINEAMPPIPELHTLEAGARLNGQSVLIHTEQGFGDMLQCCRYLQLLAELGATVICSAPKELVRLFQTLGTEIQVIPHGELLPTADYQTLLMSLPRLLWNVCPKIPDTVPYLHAPEELIPLWRERLSQLTGFKIGLAWQGRNLGKSGYQRSLGLEHLTPLLELPGCSFVSLQPQPLQLHPEILDCSDLISDFADTAALIANLDLVITVDTSVAHLVGALGARGWLALLHAPDWRWFPLESTESLWYPSLQLFRQPEPGDWSSVIHNISANLHGEILLQQGHTLGRSGDHEAAIAAFRQATQLPEVSPSAWLNLGIYQHAVGQTGEAIDSIKQAISNHPDWPEAWQNLGMLHQALRELPEAYSCFRKALTLRPDYPTARWNLGLLQLLIDDYREGFKNFEARFTKQGAVACMHTAIPVWDGSSLEGKNILIHAEQGYGDTIQFVRFLPLLSAMGGTISLEVQDSSLRELCQSIVGLEQVVVRGETLPSADFQAPLLSLPYLLGSTLDNIPRKTPYLFADNKKVRFWQQRLSPQRGFRIGICWKGRATPDHRRSLQSTLLQPLLTMPGIDWIALQVEQDRTCSIPAGVLDLTTELHDFSDTAALLVCLDLVISIDTAAAHLAGALGIPGLVLVPFAADWRWGLADRTAPWYPSLQIVRQERPGQWQTVIVALKEQIEHLLLITDKG